MGHDDVAYEGAFDDDDDDCLAAWKENMDEDVDDTFAWGCGGRYSQQFAEPMVIRPRPAMEESMEVYSRMQVQDGFTCEVETDDDACVPVCQQDMDADNDNEDTTAWGCEGMRIH